MGIERVKSGAVPVCCEAMRRAQAVRWWTERDWACEAQEVPGGAWRLLSDASPGDDVGGEYSMIDLSYAPCFFCPFCGTKLPIVESEARAIVHLARWALACARGGWIGREEALSFIDSGLEPTPGEPAHWAAARAGCFEALKAWHMRRWSK